MKDKIRRLLTLPTYFRTAFLPPFAPSSYHLPAPRGCLHPPGGHAREARNYLEQIWLRIAQAT
jgi:hypothetical protein